MIITEKTALRKRFATSCATIDAFINPYWLTFSPSAMDEPMCGDRFMDKWIPKFYKFTKCTRMLIAMMEIAEGTGRFHWHIILDVSDLYKLMIYVKGIAFSNAHPIQYKIYKGLPQCGPEYLFKDYDNTKQHLRRYEPLVCGVYLKLKYEQELQAKEAAKKAAEQDMGPGRSKFDPNVKGIPICFLESDSSDDIIIE